MKTAKKFHTNIFEWFMQIGLAGYLQNFEHVQGANDG